MDLPLEKVSKITSASLTIIVNRSNLFYDYHKLKEENILSAQYMRYYCPNSLIQAKRQRSAHKCHLEAYHFLFENLHDYKYHRDGW